MTRTQPGSLRASSLLLALLAAGGCDRAAEAPGAADGSRGGLVTDSQGATLQTAAQRSAAVDGARRTALVDATARIAPAVVSITVSSRQRVAPRTPYDFFFVPQNGEQLVRSYGTGFIVRADGAIVTNQHVVAGAERVLVTLSDGREEEARVLGEDPMTDIAVLKIGRDRLPVAPVGRSVDLMIGEWVIAIGNPYSYLLGNSEPTVSAGVVSATGRDILPTGDQPGLYLDMIQTDAAINPGNSGGPLTNALGEVVGVNSSIFSSSGGSIGLGFAIPIERALRVADEIIRTGTVRRAWTGLEVAGARAMREWKSAGGVVVTRVAPDGPAARAGIAAGDVLLHAGGRQLRNYLDWEAVKLDLHVGDSLTVSFRRGGARRTGRLVSSDLPTVTAEKVAVLRGLELLTVTPAVRAERDLRSEQGALVYRLAPDVARATGLSEGDVIVAVNRSPVRSASQLGELIDALRSGQPFRIYFEREGQYIYTDLAFR
jgi:serine protease Do